jgi:hypothetical protein
MPNPKTVVRTNFTPGSQRVVHLRAVTFQELWDNYPSGNPYDNSNYKDQCAIRMSVMFHRARIEMKSAGNAVHFPGLHPFARNGRYACRQVELIPYRASYFASPRRHQYQKKQGSAHGAALLEFGDAFFTNAGTSSQGIAGCCSFLQA